MLQILPDPLPWFVVGPAMGLVVAGMFAVANKHLGVSGGYAQLIALARGRPVEAWRLWFLAGAFGGAGLAALLGDNPQTGLEYGALGDYLSLPALIGVLLAGGVLIGYGARWAGGCTSGHGLTGCAIRSRGSMVVAATFMATALAVTLLLHWVTGGAL